MRDRHLIRPSVSTGAPSHQGEGLSRWGATPYRCFAEPLRRGADPLQSKTPLFHCQDTLRISQEEICLAFPKLRKTFAVLYQASAFQSLAMPTPDDSMPLLLYAFPSLFCALPLREWRAGGIKGFTQECCALPMLCHASPCQCIAQPLRWVSMPMRCPDRLSSSRASQCRCNMLFFLCCVLPSLCYASPKPRPTDA